MPLISSFAIALLAFAHSAYGRCKAFHQTSLAEIHDPEILGILNESIRSSPGIACGRPNLTPQFYGEGLNDTDANGRKLLRELCPGQSGCPVFSEGYSFLQAKVFESELLTKHAVFPSEIDRLVFQSAPAFRKTHLREYHRNVRGSVETARNVCLKNGTSGWVEWTPSYKCIRGHLTGCSGIEAAANGKDFTVCAPASLTGSVPKILAGSAQLHLVSSAQDAVGKKRISETAKQVGITDIGAGTRSQISILLVLVAASVLTVGNFINLSF